MSPQLVGIMGYGCLHLAHKLGTVWCFHLSQAPSQQSHNLLMKIKLIFFAPGLPKSTPSLYIMHWWVTLLLKPSPLSLKGSLCMSFSGVKSGPVCFAFALLLMSSVSYLKYYRGDLVAVPLG